MGQSGKWQKDAARRAPGPSIRGSTQRNEPGPRAGIKIKFARIIGIKNIIRAKPHNTDTARNSEKREEVTTVIILSTTIVLAIILVIPVYLSAMTLKNALDWIVRANQGKERREWLIESMLVQAYIESREMRPSFLRYYLRIVIVVRVAWLIGASATIAHYIFEWLPDWIAWPYWTIAGIIIAITIIKDAMTLKTWQSMSAPRYHPLSDLPFH